MSGTPNHACSKKGFARLLPALLAPAMLGCAGSSTLDHGLATRPAHCSTAPRLGSFDPARDLLVAAFDAKTDTDDFHSMAGLATMLADPRLACVDFIAVAGAYGKQQGEYLPAPQLFSLAFGSRWTDAHEDRAGAVDIVTDAALAAIHRGGRVWVQEAGQSDFTELVVKRVKAIDPAIDTRQHVTVIQHSVWNERETTPGALEYVRANTDYRKIPDGNALGNGTPGFKTSDGSLWATAITHPQAGPVWAEARKIAIEFNNFGGWHDNDAIRLGGFDFSDTSEAVWIFGFNDRIANSADFFATFPGVSTKP